MSKIAMVRIRSGIRHSQAVNNTLKMLNLTEKNACAVVENKPEIMGMINKVKDLITWGEVTEETLKLMEKRKRGRLYSLQPPRKGYGRKGIKVAFKVGGALGYRGEKINDLLKRMIP